MGDDAELYMEMQEPGFWDWVESLNSKYSADEDEVLEKEYKRYFFVDYENVNRDGLNGITKLTETDCVRIYYSPAAETLTFGLHRRINASKAHFDYIKVQIPIKNAVDCQILFDIRDFAKEQRKAEYFIVSKDSDFDQAVETFKANQFKVKKVVEICQLAGNQKSASNSSNTKNKNVLSDKDRQETQIRSFFEEHFKEKEYTAKKEEIVQLLLESKNRQQINNGLLKIFRNNKVGAIYKRLKPLIKDLPGR